MQPLRWLEWGGGYEDIRDAVEVIAECQEYQVDEGQENWSEKALEGVEQPRTSDKSDSVWYSFAGELPGVEAE